MLTVLQAAHRGHRDPETIRRWIRSGRLPARRVGTQQIIEEPDLLDVVIPQSLLLPKAWQQTSAGGAMPDVVAWIRSRQGR